MLVNKSRRTRILVFGDFLQLIPKIELRRCSYVQPWISSSHFCSMLFHRLVMFVLESNCLNLVIIHVSVSLSAIYYYYKLIITMCIFVFSIYFFSSFKFLETDDMFKYSLNYVSTGTAHICFCYRFV